MTKQGISFALVGVDEPTYLKVLRDMTREAVFARPLQLLAQPPKGDEPGRLTIAFEDADQEQAVQAMQRLKTIILRYGVQVDSVNKM
ncbi:hypothetical protein [Deinococcus pimensis]|uniref:hypothetical protein n=1 Tax=Deinococcus pimensis TaxID=309888 RepID=UPI0004B27214|nr:hypothetical protein [Deinococcus pimensis]